VKPRDGTWFATPALDVDNAEDLRIKMCIDITARNFTTVHQSWATIFYQRAYSKQPFLFRDSANDGVHEAIGTTIALSVTPSIWSKSDCWTAPDSSKDIGLLLKRALEKVAFLRSAC